MTASAAAETEYNAVNGENAPNLQPCDEDTTAMTQTECSALPDEQVRLLLLLLLYYCCYWHYFGMYLVG